MNSIELMTLLMFSVVLGSMVFVFYDIVNKATKGVK
jgi:hypothetical protein